MPDEPIDPLLEKVLTLAEAGDDAGLRAWLAGEAPLQATPLCTKAQMTLYWKRKNVPAVVMLSQVGMAHALAAADAVQDVDQQRALQNSARRLAYNLASFTWSGWNEPGIALTAADRAAGLEAAQRCVELTERVEGSAKAQANAHWALGAQRLAAGDFAGAATSFDTGVAQARLVGDANFVRMFEGYLALARLLANRGDAGAAAAFEGIVEALGADPSEDAAEYARQLPVARAVLER